MQSLIRKQDVKAFSGRKGDSRPGHGELVEQKDGEVGEREAWKGDFGKPAKWEGASSLGIVLRLCVMMMMTNLDLKRWRAGGWSTREATTP